MKKATVREGWIYANSKTGLVWPDTFDVQKNICQAKAAEGWGVDGQTPKDHPEWSPVKCLATFIIQI